MEVVLLVLAVGLVEQQGLGLLGVESAFDQ